MEEQPPIHVPLPPRYKLWFRGKRALWIAVAFSIVLLLVVAAIMHKPKGSRNSASQNTAQTQEVAEQKPSEESAAIKAGKQLTNSQCEGEGVPYKLSESPMRADEFSMVIPYGLMVGDHVTPIDHQYFSPKDYKSKVDAYEVRAMADSTIVDIGSRPRPFGQEYRLVFTISCTFLYYYDLVTSLTPEIKAIYENSIADQAMRKPVNIKVKAGQLIGRIGGQTLDFAVWDTTKPLSGFVLREHYEAESWKLYTADPLDYYTDELKSFLLSRYVRTVEPISGKIDYDIDGKLIGNWFQEGSNGYYGFSERAGTGAEAHLAFAPEHLDPSWFVISMGNFAGQPAQYIAKNNTPDPKDVSIDTGLVKYDLAEWSYLKSNGSFWDRTSFAQNVTVKPSASTKGCALVQMLETRKLKFESFKGKSCSSVSGFSSSAKNYTR